MQPPRKKQRQTEGFLARAQSFVKFSLVSSCSVKVPAHKLAESGEPRLRPAVVVFVPGNRVVKATYLLPCSCGAKVPVDAAQAGQVIPCACGQSLTVPSLLAVKKLEPAESPPAADSARAAWGLSQRLTVMGIVVVALTALASYGTVGRTPAPVDPNSLQTFNEFKRFASTHRVSEVSGTANVFHEYAHSLPINKAYSELLSVKHHGLDRGLTREDEMFTRSMALYRMWCAILAGMGVVGVGLIACGILARFATPQS